MSAPAFIYTSPSIHPSKPIEPAASGELKLRSGMVAVELVLLFLVLSPRAAAAATAASADVVVSATPTPTPTPAPTVCANSGTLPVMLGEPLRFCGNTGISCCDTATDDALREELHAMNIPGATCAAIVKSFLCGRCIPSLSFVFSSADPRKLSVPLLCASAQAQPHPVVAAGSASGSTTTRPAQEQDTSSACLERVSAASFHTMTAHPDGSGRVFLTSRDGKLWLATMPERGVGAATALRIKDGGSARQPRPFLDLTDRVHLHHRDDGVLGGVMGVAFHPEFTTNGRFFVSYICDSRSSVSPPACGGAGDPNGSSRRSRTYRYYLVVAEFSAQGGGGSDYSRATRADPSELRRIFTLGLPQTQFKLYSYQSHGGQILFRPSESDGYLYLITGYGHYFSNKSRSSSFFGKILRFNLGSGMIYMTRPHFSTFRVPIHSTPSILNRPRGSEWSDTDRHPEWTDKPEVFVAGLSHPSACSFDSDRPSRLWCADVNEQRSERVYLVTNQLGGRSSSSSSVATVSVVVNHGRPADGRMPSIVGGLVYRGSADTSLRGRYLYVYASGVWSASAHHHQALNVSCSWSSPVPCRSSRIGIGSRVLSMAEDNSKDAFFLTTAGVFRLVPSGACGAPRPQPRLPAPGADWKLAAGVTAVALAVFFWWQILGGGGGPQIHIGCNSNSIFCCSGPYQYQVLNNSALPHQS